MKPSDQASPQTEVPQELIDPFSLPLPEEQQDGWNKVVGHGV